MEVLEEYSETKFTLNIPIDSHYSSIATIDDFNYFHLKYYCIRDIFSKT